MRRGLEFLINYPFFFVAVWLSLIVVQAREGLPLDYIGLGMLVFVAAYVHFSPDLIEGALKRRKNFGWVNYGTGAVLSLFFFFMVCWVFKGVGLTVLGLTMVFLLVLNKDKFFFKEHERKTLFFWTFLLGSMATIPPLVVTILAFRYSWHHGYLSLFFDEKVLLRDLIFDTRDTFSQLSYTMMLTKYHEIASGLHGTDPMKYHVGVHLFLGGISNLLRRPASFVFNYGFPIVVVPMLFQVFYRLTSGLLVVRSVIEKAIVLIVISIFFVQFIPDDIANIYMVGHGLFYSESYGFGLWCMFAYLCCLLLTPFKNLVGREKNRWQFAFQDVLLPVFLGWVCFTKVSLGFMCSLVFGVYFFELIRRKSYITLVSAVLSFIGCLAVKKVVLGKAVVINKDAFLRNYYGGEGKWFHIIHFYQFWLVLILFGALGLAAFTDWKRKGRSRLWEITRIPRLLFVIQIILFIPIYWMFRYLEMQSQIGYFTSPFMWLSTLTLVVTLLTVFFYGGSRVFQGVLVVLMVIAGYKASENVGGWLKEYNALKKKDFAFKKQYLDRAVSNEVLDYSKYVHKLRDIAKIESKDYLVMLKRTEKRFWSQFRFQFERCQLAPLLIVAESQKPALFSIQYYLEFKGDNGCSEFLEMDLWFAKSPGFWEKVQEFKNNPNSGLVCEETRRFKMKGFYSLEWDEPTQDVQIKKFECGPSGPPRESYV